MTNPLDYTIQDPEAMRYALMQDSSYRGGGAVRMADGGKADEDLFALKPQPKPAVPTVRELVAQIGKSPARYEAKYPAKDFTPLELQAYRLMQAAKATPDANRYLESLNPYFDSQLKFDIGAGSDAGYVEPKVPNLAVVQQLQDVKNTIPHELTHTLQLGKGANVDLERDKQTMQRAQALPAAMQQSVMSSKNGFDDMQEVWANINARAHEVNAAGGDFINSPEGRALFPTNTEQRDYYTNAMPGVNSMTPSTGTFVPNKAEGGIIDGHPVFTTAQTPFAEYRHSIGMNQGGKHFDEGGEASLDQMRYELTNPYGTNYERFVPSTNAFSVNEKPASLAYTQHDVPIVTESGGIAPVPRTVHDDRMAEIEKQLDKGVKPDWMSGKDFLQDQAERKGYNTTDTSISALGQNVLAALGNSHILGGAFRALGAPYEAAEKVLGSSMGLDPMTGIIGKTGELHSIPKAGQYAASRAAPVLSKIDQAVRSGYESGAIPQPGLSIKDVTPKALAPANEQGFYSPTEAAALNLQRKSGNGQAFLNDLLKQENVRPDEINAMGLDTFLKGKTNVTADEVQDYIAKNKLGLGESTYKEKPSMYQFARQQGMSEDDAAGVVIKAQEGDPKAVEIVNAYENFSTPKFKQYSMPGGENYREVVLTLPAKETSYPTGSIVKDGKDAEHPFAIMVNGVEANRVRSMDYAQEVLQEEIELAARKKNTLNYQSSHFDEPNILAHLRMSDRVTDGKKTLLVDEVQSDWHQAGRERGYKDPQAEKAYEIESKAIAEERKNLVAELSQQEKQNGFVSLEGQKKWDEFKEKENALREKGKELSSAAPDAPYKEDWYQLALRRAVKEAIDGGYDRVALPTGARVNERFDLSKQIDRIDYNKNPDGTYNMSAIKDGSEVFAKEGLDEKELSGIIGKDVAKKIVGDEGSSAPKADRWEAEDGDVPEFKSLSGLDLQVGGEGNRKYYDEIYPGYLKKFGKKYGATVGKTTVDANGVAEPLHYMEITPAMRKEFSTGIHMKKGGKVSFADSLDAMRYELTKAK